MKRSVLSGRSPCSPPGGKSSFGGRSQRLLGSFMVASSSTKVHGAWWGGFATEEIGWGLVGDAGADSVKRRRGKGSICRVRKLVMFRKQVWEENQRRFGMGSSLLGSQRF
jgi:hypothetical protein